MPKQPKPTRHKVSHVRIIGGRHRGRKLDFIDHDKIHNHGIRPTPDRVRETLFNWLTGHLTDARVLDVCAGSGVLGFESLSRGAASTVMIELDTAQFALLVASCHKLGLNNAVQLYQGDAISIIGMLESAPFDVIFIDPPYNQGLYRPILDALGHAKLYNADTLIYIESDYPIEALLETLFETGNHTDSHQTKHSPQILKSTKAGQVHAALLTLT